MVWYVRLWHYVYMKTTIDISRELLEDVKKAAGVRANREAITADLNEYLRIKRSADLATVLGTFEDAMTRETTIRATGNSAGTTIPKAMLER